ncbi:XRE family transcriptional regulator [bacterium D16-51]|nr:XRE family transcriptional regulator [bacterium D16-59]RKI54312.1 XRE family transcriptional regulator [bacterium D16-51]
MEKQILYNPLNTAEKIKYRAKTQNVIIKDMLVELELGSNTMSNMRHGRAIASDSLARIADYLDCSIDYLMGRTDNPDINR